MMAKTIITQNGTIVNYSKLLAVYVDENLDDEEQILGYDLIGVTGADQDAQALILGSYPDEAAAVQAKNELIRWLQSEAFSTFEMPISGEDGGV